MAVVATAVAIPAGLLLRGDDDVDDPEVPPIELLEENEWKADKLALAGSAPGGWGGSINETHVEARSLSGLGRVVITVPGSAEQAGDFFREAIDALGLVFDDVNAGETMRDAQIDERPTRSALVALKRSDGREVQAAVAVADV